MTNRRFAGFLLLSLVAPLPAQEIPHALFRPRTDTLLYPLGDRPILLLHATTPDGGRRNGSVRAGARFAVVAAHTRPLSDADRARLERSEAAYAAGAYQKAADIARRVYTRDSTNMFALNDYARALFRIASRRRASLDAYRRLLDTLDRQMEAPDSAVPVDLSFIEAYRKIGALYLDVGEYEHAAFEIARGLAGGIAPPPAVE